MHKVLGLLLLATLALGNTQHEAVEGLIECVMTFIPKVLEDAQKVYTDIQNQDYDALAVDAQALADDSQAALDCVKIQAQLVLKSQSDNETLGDVTQCIAEEAKQFQYFYEKLLKDLANKEYVSAFNDIQYILLCASDILDCLKGKSSAAESRPIVESLLSEKDSLACVAKFLPALLTDAANLLNDFQKSDFTSLLPHAESLATDSQAFVACLEA